MMPNFVIYLSGNSSEHPFLLWKVPFPYVVPLPREQSVPSVSRATSPTIFPESVSDVLIAQVT
jgi:hypothetical protein